MSNKHLQLRLFRDATGEYCLEVRNKVLMNHYHMVHRFDTEADRADFMTYHSLELS